MLLLLLCWVKTAVSVRCVAWLSDSCVSRNLLVRSSDSSNTLTPRVCPVLLIKTTWKFCQKVSRTSHNASETRSSANGKTFTERRLSRLWNEKSDRSQQINRQIYRRWTASRVRDPHSSAELLEPTSWRDLAIVARIKHLWSVVNYLCSADSLACNYLINLGERNDYKRCDFHCTPCLPLDASLIKSEGILGTGEGGEPQEGTRGGGGRGGIKGYSLTWSRPLPSRNIWTHWCAHAGKPAPHLWWKSMSAFWSSACKFNTVLLLISCFLSPACV